MDAESFKRQIWIASTLSKGVYELDAGRDYDFGEYRVAGFVRSGNAYAVIVEDSETIWVAISGTNEAIDWLHDVDAKKTSFGGVGRVHRGFYRHAREIDADIFELVNRLQGEGDNVRPVYFTGHSLGGAASTILASTYKRSGMDTRAIVFGSPRAFDCKAAQAIDHSLRVDITRIENVTDIVTDVPLKGRFCHVGRALYFSKSGKATTEERPAITRLWFTVRRWVRRVYAWDVHSMSEYRRRLLIWKGE